jgi:metal-responsive CopG/Arc/MetJ family transcriptional regulator
MNKKRVAVTLDESTLQLLDMKAKEKGLQRSTFLNLFLKEKLSKDKKENLL